MAVYKSKGSTFIVNLRILCPPKKRILNLGLIFVQLESENICYDG